MRRKAEPLEVMVTNDSAVDIVQDYYDEPIVIRVPYDQIDLLVQWLQEAKAELGSKRKARPQRKPKHKDSPSQGLRPC